MRLLITAADGRLARSVATSFANSAAIRAFDLRFTSPLPAGVQACEGDLRDSFAVTTALQDIDAVLHLTPISVDESTDDVTALDVAARGTYTLMNAAKAAGVERVVLASTLDLFDRVPSGWRVTETWRPRPEPTTAQLCAWLAELSAREVARESTLRVLCLRFDHIVDDAQIATSQFDPRWLHVDDAVAAIRRALAYNPPAAHVPAWDIFHIPGPHSKIRLSHCASAQPAFGYAPAHQWDCEPDSARDPDDRTLAEILAPRDMPSRPIRRAVIFGAGGPLGAAVARELGVLSAQSASYILRLADLRPLAQIAAEAKPQSPGAPIAAPLDSPHENALVDVRDPAQVLAACDGMDAIINCSVVRNDPAGAFGVNLIGFRNMLQAAVACGIRRVVQTGPLLVTVPGRGDYHWDYDLSVDAPARPFADLYHHTKYLGQEAGRVFAAYHGLEVPVLQFAGLIDLGWPGGRDDQFIVSWQDAARAVRCALEVPALPSPWEPFFILTDPPQSRFDNAKAKRLLNWQPRDHFSHFWQE